jgi:hypothetical protein
MQGRMGRFSFPTHPKTFLKTIINRKCLRHKPICKKKGNLKKLNITEVTTERYAATWELDRPKFCPLITRTK